MISLSNLKAMSSFSHELLEKKLLELNSSQESVETLSLWMLHHRKNANVIVKYWAEKFLIVSESRKLAFIFLAHDILKARKIKSYEYRKEFRKVLPDILRHVVVTCTMTQLFYQIRRILNLWRKTGVFEEKDLLDFYENLNSIEAPKTSKKEQCSIDEMEESGEIRKVCLSLNVPTSEELIDALRELENAPSGDEDTRAKISALPKKFLDSKFISALRDSAEAKEFIKNLETNVAVVEGYNERLQQEVMQRERLNDMLEAYKESELERLTENERNLEKVEKELEDLAALCEELHRHHDSLPDMEQYRCVQELPPLPSVEDLFKKPY